MISLWRRPPIVPHEIISDEHTVWVNGVQGCIARFGPNGIDIHTEDTASCLHCTHEPTEIAEWLVFQAKMREHYGITVTDAHRPTRLNAAAD